MAESYTVEARGQGWVVLEGDVTRARCNGEADAHRIQAALANLRWQEEAPPSVTITLGGVALWVVLEDGIFRIDEERDVCSTPFTARQRLLALALMDSAREALVPRGEGTT